MEGSDQPSYSNTHDEDSGIKFSPPLYQQRYHRVYDILKQESVSRVVDFGCAECRSLRLFRDLPLLERLIGVDIDDELLKKHRDRVRPLVSHYLFRKAKRLVVQILHGNLLEWDNRLRDIEAVTMIEVIEHLFQDGVERLPHALFGIIHPRLVIITTPNEEFNVLFTGLIGFRHPDHKFEWNRREFSDWCSRVCEQYGYSVDYDGVGEAPDGSTHLGFCSQIAIFRRLDDSSGRFVVAAAPSTDCNPYVQVGEYEYPGETEGVTTESKLHHEVLYFFRLLCRCADEDRLNTESSLIPCDATLEAVIQDLTLGEDTDEDVNYIELSKLMSFNKVHEGCNGGDLDILRKVLTTAGYSLTSDTMSVICPVENENHSNSKYYDDEEEDDLSAYEQTGESADDIAKVLTSEHCYEETELWG